MENSIESLKVVIVGDGGCGKTFLLHAYTNQSFADEYIPTVLDTYSADIKVGGKKIPIEIYDTAGQEDFENIRTMVYPGSNVFIMCYSCVNETSLKNIDRFWHTETHKTQAGVGVPIILVGNKLDLKDENPKEYVSEAKANEMMAKIEAKAHVQCSAFDETQGGGDTKNVENVFKLAIKYGLQHLRNPPPPPVKPCTRRCILI